jgi:hypothetical protein
MIIVSLFHLAEDLAVLRKSFISSPSNTVGGMVTKRIKPEKMKVVMDGLTRRKVAIKSLFIKREYDFLKKDFDIAAYIVGGRDVLRTWEKISPVVVVVPDEAGWKDKSNRIFADELAFYNQAIVVMPDVTACKTADDVFDTVVSALRFAQTEYDSKAVSMSGIGAGGGVVLTIAAELGSCMTVDTREAEERLRVDAFRQRSFVFEAVPEIDSGIGPSIGIQVNATAPIGESMIAATSTPEATMPQPVGARRLVEDAPPFIMRLNSNSSLSLQQLEALVPCALFVICPNDYDVDFVGSRLVSPLYAVFGDKPLSPMGSRCLYCPLK